MAQGRLQRVSAPIDRPQVRAHDLQVVEEGHDIGGRLREVEADPRARTNGRGRMSGTITRYFWAKPRWSSHMRESG
jgi:hypothetical protein